MILITTLATLFALAPQEPEAPREPEKEFSLDLSVDALSAYVWRGAVLGADDKLVLQPAMTLSSDTTGLSLGVWGSFYAQDRDDLEDFDEIDITLDLSRSFGESALGYSAGYIQYVFPQADRGGRRSEEVYVGLNLDSALAPSVTFFYDVNLIDDFYLQLSVAPEFPLMEGDAAPTLALSASLGLSGEGYGGHSGFNDFTVTATLNFSLGGISIGPTAGATVADEEKYGPDDRTVWGGVSLGFGL